MKARTFKNKPLVSIIVPFYNEEKYIEECLDSVKKQTYPHIELIVVDDGSTDTSTKLAKKYADVFLHQKHNGPGAARNKAAKIAKGEILIFVDADMYLDRMYIEKIIKPILDKKSVATFTNEEFVANFGNIWVKCGSIDNGIPYGLRNKNKSSLSEVARAIKKDIFLKIGGMKSEVGYGEDHILSKYKAISSKGAICYHYNPDTLKEVYLSARWVGRSALLPLKIKNLLRYSVINSLIISIKKIHKGTPWRFLIYKIVFDLGIFCGILFKNEKNYYAK